MTSAVAGVRLANTWHRRCLPRGQIRLQRQQLQRRVDVEAIRISWNHHRRAFTSYPILLHSSKTSAGVNGSNHSKKNNSSSSSSSSGGRGGGDNRMTIPLNRTRQEKEAAAAVESHRSQQRMNNLPSVEATERKHEEIAATTTTATTSPAAATTTTTTTITKAAGAPLFNHSQTHFVKGGVPCDPAPPPFTLAEYGEGSVYTLVLLRHGESEWNSQNRYTGWCDVNLTKRGEREARAAGRLLLQNGIEIDHAFTSVLKRASYTTNMTLNMAKQHWVPITKTWRLNERHYGALQGYEKDSAYKELGIDQELVMEMRRSYETRPPRMENDHPYWHGNDRRYAKLSHDQLEASRGESLKDTAKRIMPFFNSVIIPSLQSGNKCLVVSHANTLRSLIKQIDHISDSDIKGMSIPTGIPLLYRLDKNLRPVDPSYELDFRYMVEPKGYTWATSRAYGFHGVYLGDVERLQDIQKKRDATNRDWQRIILRNLAQTLDREGQLFEKEQQQNQSSSDSDSDKHNLDHGNENDNTATTGDDDVDDSGSGGGDGVFEVRQLWWQIHRKVKHPEFANMILLARMKSKLETLLLERRQKYMTMQGYESLIRKIHLDSAGQLCEPFLSLEDQQHRQERQRVWNEYLNSVRNSNNNNNNKRSDDTDTVAKA